ncbi:hypothetical protein GQ53DRAFT_663523 [Thozetella sp. PMI_491]|nr:hypothetical protein GQ53DRAFT_663523 [Thozetella sp. PMI_491]
MAPIRRYLRITKYSVLECRIYLDNPALAQSWLLNPRDPVLPRVIEAVRPLVLPKLEEEKERERNRRKGTKKKRSIKDVVTQDEFEVAIFLTETNTRHSLLYKQKHFRDKTQTKLTSNSSKLVGASSEAPIDVDDGELLHEYAGDADVPGLRREDSEEDGAIALENIPSVDDVSPEGPEIAAQRPKRGRHRAKDGQVLGDAGTADAGAIEIESSDDDLFVGSTSSAESDADSGGEMRPPPAKRRRDQEGVGDRRDIDGPSNDKKKMAMDISYDGFAIYGRVLCLVVKRRDGGGRAGGPRVAGGRSQTGAAGQLVGQASMENWITSTQLPADAADDIEAS